jgi:Relaxase/Mobilisation nuclease domain
MARHPIDLGSSGALLDLHAFARAGRRTLTLTPKQARTIAFTVRRAPEVMVKVSGGARTLAGVKAHFAYIGRDGELGVEFDYGTRVAGKGFEKQLVLDWDLDLQAHRRQDARSILGKRRTPKLVHNLIFSMPPGTSPTKVLGAVRRLAVNEFALQHRYALVLHTDEEHPHVHLVVKAESEQGVRLNIRKATLRHWREQFAMHLQDLGVAATATERAVRGETRTPKKDGIYRAAQRGMSTYEMNEARKLAEHSADFMGRFDRGRQALQGTRMVVVAGWRAVARQFEEEGLSDLAGRVRRFVEEMPPPATDQVQLARRFATRERSQRVDSLDRTR